MREINVYKQKFLYTNCNLVKWMILKQSLMMKITNYQYLSKILYSIKSFKWAEVLHSSIKISNSIQNYNKWLISNHIVFHCIV